VRERERERERERVSECRPALKSILALSNLCPHTDIRLRKTNRQPMQILDTNVIFDCRLICCQNKKNKKIHLILFSPYPIYLLVFNMR